MIQDLILILYFIAWYLLVTVAFLFCISGADDLFFDVYYWIRYLRRKWKMRYYSPLTYEDLKQKPEKKIAILLPCWQEANIIRIMLTHNCYHIEYENYDIFVGVYANDNATVSAVKHAEKYLKRVHCVVGRIPGPTNKASNLNEIYHFIAQYEQEHELSYDIFVFHDSEDIIHPLSFKLYNYLIPRKDMIQIPVFPLEVNYFNFTHWVYNDEFCENHTKDIVVRESIKGLVPSAGVGTAFSKHALEMLAADNKGQPFSTYSLTEDYKTALAIRLKGLKQIFATQFVLRTKWKRHWFLWGHYKKIKVKEFIATRALFPTDYLKAVRQKARWIIGISMQEWKHTGLVGNLSTKYTLLHDRKSLITHFVNILGYALLIFWIIYGVMTKDNPRYPSLQEQLNLHSWVWYVIMFATFVMFERLLQRFIATIRVYGWLPAILSIFRIPFGNVLNLHALLRAYRIYFFSPKTTKKGVNWDKTEHEFPGSHVLIPFKHRLGDLLLQNQLLTNEQLEKALSEQRKSGDQLGEILQKHHYIGKEQLMRMLAMQYELSFIAKEKIKMLKRHEMQGISWYNYAWLKHYHILPIDFNRDKKNITLAIPDPSNEALLKQAILHTKPYNVEFVMYGDV